MAAQPAQARPPDIDTRPSLGWPQDTAMPPDGRRGSLKPMEVVKLATIRATTVAGGPLGLSSKSLG